MSKNLFHHGDAEARRTAKSLKHGAMEPQPIQNQDLRRRGTGEAEEKKRGKRKIGAEQQRPSLNHEEKPEGRRESKPLTNKSQTSAPLSTGSGIQKKSKENLRGARRICRIAIQRNPSR